jgi:hypothetical protein
MVPKDVEAGTESFQASVQPTQSLRVTGTQNAEVLLDLCSRPEFPRQVFWMDFVSWLIRHEETFPFS